MTIRRFFTIIQRRAIVIWCVIAVGVAAMYALRGAVPSSFAGVSHVLLVAENGARDPSVSIVDLPSIATSTVVLQRVRNSLKLPISLIALKSGISASVLGRSTIMAISFRDHTSEGAISVSNAVADELSRYYDEISTQRYDVNVSRLSAQLATEAHKLSDLDAQMSRIVARNPYVVSEKSVDAITTRITSLNEQRALARAQLSGDQALANTTSAGEGLSAAARHEILQGDPQYQSIRAVAAKDDAQLASDQALYTTGFPGLPGEQAKVVSEILAAERAAARALADPNAYSPSAAGNKAQHARQVAVIDGDQARLRQLDALATDEQSRLGDLPTIGAEYAQLRAQRDVLQTEYNGLATRRANALANRAEASSLGSVVVLDRAIKADTQLAGGRTRVAVVALVFVLALALGSAFLVDALDPRIRRAEDIEELYGIPVVANVGAKA